MLALGFDDVEDYENMEDGELQNLRKALLSNNVPEGHVGKIVRAIKARRPAHVDVAPPPLAPSTPIPQPRARQPRQQRRQKSLQ